MNIKRRRAGAKFSQGLRLARGRLLLQPRHPLPVFLQALFRDAQIPLWSVRQCAVRPCCSPRRLDLCWRLGGLASELTDRVCERTFIHGASCSSSAPCRTSGIRFCCAPSSPTIRKCVHRLRNIVNIPCIALLGGIYSHRVPPHCAEAEHKRQGEVALHHRAWEPTFNMKHSST